MRKITLFLFFLFTITSCVQTKEVGLHMNNKEIQTHFQWVMNEVRNPESENVLVAAHRGDWRNTPENSIQALKNCINMGVDIVEIDLKKTKDGHLILMHDKTIDRTTTGKGRPEDFTLDSLKTFYLKRDYGIATKHKIPTFEEYMLAAKGKMFICVDKCYPYLREVFEVLQRTGTANQVILNSEKNLQENRKDYGDLINRINFKPVVELDNAKSNKQVMEYASELQPLVMELIFKTDTSHYVQNSSLLRSQHIKIWHNALWGSLCAGHDDDIAVEENRPADSWDWLIAHGATIIQTDRPYLLLQYLKNKKLHQ